jgi:hypothetical protein
MTPEQRIAELECANEQLALETRMLRSEIKGLESMILRTLKERKDEAELLDPKTPGEENL